MEGTALSWVRAKFDINSRCFDYMQGEHHAAVAVVCAQEKKEGRVSTGH